jgi:hypothetical protein
MKKYHLGAAIDGGGALAATPKVRHRNLNHIDEEI